MAGRRRDSGFTVLEILVVVGLMGLITALFLPNLGGIFRFEIRRAARVVTADLEYASQRAVATGRLHRWVVDLDEQTFRIEEVQAVSASADDPEAATHSDLLDLRAPIRTWEAFPVDNKTGEWRWLEQEGVWIDRVTIGDEEHRAGTAQITFGADGGADPAEVWIGDGSGRRLRITVLAFTGEIRVEEAPDA